MAWDGKQHLECCTADCNKVYDATRSTHHITEQYSYPTSTLNQTAFYTYHSRIVCVYGVRYVLYVRMYIYLLPYGLLLRQRQKTRNAGFIVWRKSIALNVV